jgi:hypothetical protein
VSEKVIEEELKFDALFNCPPIRVAESCPKTAKELPADVIADLEGYLNEGDEPSPFLRAVLERDLRHAGEVAPREVSLRKLHLLAQFIYEETPGNSHGDQRAVYLYIAERKRQKQDIEDDKQWLAEQTPLVLSAEQQREARVLWGFLATGHWAARKELERAAPLIREAIRRAQNEIAAAHQRLDEENPFEEPTETDQPRP